MEGSKQRLAETVTCPACGAKFIPVPDPDVRKQLKYIASIITKAAAGVGVIGCLLLLCGTVAACLDEASSKGFPWILLGSSLVSAALLLFISAQLLHIRANTESKS